VHELHRTLLEATAGRFPNVDGAVDDPPRVVRSRSHRRDVHVHGDGTGVVTIGRGLVGRLEVAVEHSVTNRPAQVGD